jgi:ParB family chromosome partitioning protein
MGKFAGLQKLATRIADLDSSAVDSQNGNGSSPSLEFTTNGSFSYSPTSSFITIPLSSIVVGNRIRQHLDAEKTQSLAYSIQRHGFRGVLWVRLVNGEYHLIAGGRRYAACQIAGITAVPVEVWDITDAESLQLELLENFQREDLNPIEEAEGILRMLEVTLELERSEVIAVLGRMSRRGKDNVVLREDEDSQQALYQQVEEVFQLIGRHTPESFRTHRLPLLNLPRSLVDAVSNGLEYTKARAIAQIKDEDAREQVLAQALEQELSLSEIRELVDQLKRETQSGVELSVKRQLYNRVQGVAKRFKSANVPARKIKKLTRLLEEIELLLSEE